jgi:glycosyltransferase involved in cell wall biosynthesis
MKIAHFHTNTILSSWTNLAVLDAFKELGHETYRGAIPVNQHGAVLTKVSSQQFQEVKTACPTFEELQDCDFILISGPEYLSHWLDSLYTKKKWMTLKNKIGWHLESSSRKDLAIKYEDFLEWSDIHFFCDPEDVTRFKGHQMPLAVDTKMFNPGIYTTKRYDVGFVGTVYPKRVEFLNSLKPHLGSTMFRAAGVSVRDLGGECQEDWAKLLVNNIRQLKIHVNLPSNNSNMWTSRPFETMACSTFLLTPKLDQDIFEDGIHCVFYDPLNPEELAERIRFYLSHDYEREAIARKGCIKVRQEFSLIKKMDEMLKMLCTPQATLV